MRLEPGSRLGPYEILGLIGAGGMGEVYRARDPRLNREVAIKVLPSELAGDRERLVRFEREARSASALNHRNIVTIHDFTLDGGEGWLVMELIRGESLRDLVGRGPLTFKRLIPLATGIADGLAAAHDAGIVHRDLKPENIMITEDGTPKVLDFGLVKGSPGLRNSDATTEMRVSRSGMIMGTASYMSPEQARGDDLDFRTDQFSFGLILHEMVTGRHPFARPTAAEMLTAIMKEDPPPLPSGTPEPVAEIVERCLARERGQRYGSTADLAHDLSRAGSRPQRTPAVSPMRTVRWWWLLPLLLIIGTAAVLALRPRQTTVAAAPMHVDVATPDLASVALDEIAPPISISPDGRHLVVSGTGLNSKEGLWVYDLRLGTSRLLAEKGRLPAWSSDSRAVAFFADGKLKTVPVEGGPPRIICDARPEGMPAWHGDTILYGQYSKDPGLYRVSASGGPPKLVIGAGRNGRFNPPWWPRFLPDGKRFLFTRFFLGGTSPEVDHQLLLATLDGRETGVVNGLNSRVELVGDRLLFVREGTLLTQRFDVDEGKLVGEARPILQDVFYFRSTGMAAFSASANGVLAWRSARQPSRLVWLDRAGFEQQTVASALVHPEARLSPDGTKYAVSVIDPKYGVSDVWVYDLTRQSSDRLTFRVLDERAPVWFPDGQMLLYRSDGTGGPPDILRLRPGDERGELVHRGPGVDEPQDVSTDGKWLLFVDYFATGTDINLLPLDGSGPARRYVATPFNEASPRFSTDGRWVAYASDVSGVWEVYVRTFDDPPVTRRVSKDGGTRPRWRRDGRELFYLGPEGRLMAVPIENGTPGTTRMLFQSVEISDFDPAPDGSRFLVQLREQSKDTSVHLLLNWPSLLGSNDAQISQ
jgi:eukaryotic-like serine/threonine-protein kinase